VLRSPPPISPPGRRWLRPGLFGACALRQIHPCVCTPNRVGALPASFSFRLDGGEPLIGLFVFVSRSLSWNLSLGVSLFCGLGLNILRGRTFFWHMHLYSIRGLERSELGGSHGCQWAPSGPIFMTGLPER